MWNCQGLSVSSILRSKMLLDKALATFSHILNLVCSTSLPQELVGNLCIELGGTSLESGRFQLALPTLPSSSEPRPFRSEGYQQAGCGGTGHKLNSQNCVFMGSRSPLPTRTCELEPSYTLIEEGLWKSLYSTQIQVRSGTTIPHAFLTTSPSH